MTREDEIVGLSSKQILDAPLCAVYLVRDFNHVGYAKELARVLGRRDLDIKPLSWLDPVNHRLTVGVAGLVVDHAVPLAVSHLDVIESIRHKVEAQRRSA